MLDKTKQDWTSLAAEIEFEGRAFINGRYQDALAGETRPTMSPGDGQKLTDVANCGTEDADNAVGIAALPGQHSRAASGQTWRLPIGRWCWCVGPN
jgi:hypothetical protein